MSLLLEKGCTGIGLQGKARDKNASVKKDDLRLVDARFGEAIPGYENDTVHWNRECASPRLVKMRGILGGKAKAHISRSRRSKIEDKILLRNPISDTVGNPCKGKTDKTCCGKEYPLQQHVVEALWQGRRDSNPQLAVLENAALAVRATALCATYFVSR